ncbi:class I SAM-dependent methyltransferase [Neotabrizicola shimadae]|uniref:class I SAM-dependent methyltransferase n=1 Tax=Neotabrizicola shimadae TaxID=2807096 RepID=UPI002176D1F4|nr:class I SAM-dependent methyltransferase [Neotabrizicola shimadae]
MPAPDAQTLAFYSEFAPTYVASGAGGVSRHLPYFLEVLKPGSTILELGCGGGRDAQAMIAAGHRVDPTDGSAAIAAKAEALLQIPVRVMRFDELEAEEDYDAVWANASLLHVPRPDLPEVLSKVRRALKPGGLHHASYKGGDREGRDSHGRYFNYLSRDELVAIYEASGDWDILSVVEYIGGGFDKGVQGPWLAILTRRPE